MVVVIVKEVDGNVDIYIYIYIYIYKERERERERERMKRMMAPLGLMESEESEGIYSGEGKSWKTLVTLGPLIRNIFIWWNGTKHQ